LLRMSCAFWIGQAASDRPSCGRKPCPLPCSRAILPCSRMPARCRPRRNICTAGETF
jgi:hypothetical protein